MGCLTAAREHVDHVVRPVWCCRRCHSSPSASRSRVPLPPGCRRTSCPVASLVVPSQPSPLPPPPGSRSRAASAAQCPSPVDWSIGRTRGTCSGGCGVPAGGASPQPDRAGGHRHRFPRSTRRRPRSWRCVIRGRRRRGVDLDRVDHENLRAGPVAARPPRPRAGGIRSVLRSRAHGPAARRWLPCRGRRSFRLVASVRARPLARRRRVEPGDRSAHARRFSRWCLPSARRPTPSSPPP